MMESGLIPDISPTYLTNIEPIKVSDTVNLHAPRPDCM